MNSPAFCPSNMTVAQMQQENNQRMYDRNVPSQMLQPYLDVRPVMTKYSYFPIVDPRRNIKTPFQQYPTYNPHTCFNPGNATAPWSGFASNINTESELRNQIYALQSCSQSVYVPSSKSDLYQNKFQITNTTNQTHPLLFESQSFPGFNPNPNSNTIGVQMFMNSTRVQLKES